MWRFTKHEPSQPIRDPIEGEFFQQEDDSRTARHLVRESIQNSLDAQIEGTASKGQVLLSAFCRMFLRSDCTPV